jgi:hypothetical protein
MLFSRTTSAHPKRASIGHVPGCTLATDRGHAFLSTCGLVAMTSASHAEGRQFDPGQVYCGSRRAPGVHFDTEFVVWLLGPVAQWIRHRPTEPGIAGSSPAGVIWVRAAACKSARGARRATRRRILPAGFEPATYGS